MIGRIAAAGFLVLAAATPAAADATSEALIRDFVAWVDSSDTWSANVGSVRSDGTDTIAEGLIFSLKEPRVSISIERVRLANLAARAEGGFTASEIEMTSGNALIDIARAHQAVDARILDPFGSRVEHFDAEPGRRGDRSGSPDELVLPLLHLGRRGLLRRDQRPGNVVHAAANAAGRDRADGDQVRLPEQLGHRDGRRSPESPGDGADHVSGRLDRQARNSRSPSRRPKPTASTSAPSPASSTHRHIATVAATTSGGLSSRASSTAR